MAGRYVDCHSANEHLSRKCFDRENGPIESFVDVKIDSYSR